MEQHGVRLYVDGGMWFRRTVTIEVPATPLGPDLFFEGDANTAYVVPMEELHVSIQVPGENLVHSSCTPKGSGWIGPKCPVMMRAVPG